VINAIKFSIEEIEASDQYFDHTGSHTAAGATGRCGIICGASRISTPPSDVC
jgi:hypothetical protein